MATGSRQFMEMAAGASLMNPALAEAYGQAAGQVAGTEMQLESGQGFRFGMSPQMSSLTLPGGGRVSGHEGAQLAFQAEQWRQADARRQQMLNLLGLTPEFQQGGGLFGTEFFGSILGNTLPGVTGGVAGALGPVLGGGGGRVGQPGFRDSPSTPGTPSIPGGPTGQNGLFGEQIAGRGQLGGAIMDMLSGYGQSQRTEIGRQFSNAGQSALAGLEQRGLGSSSLVPATQMATAREEQRALGELEDRLTGQRVGALQQIGEGIFGDVGSELDRRVTGRGQVMDLLSSLFGSALKIV